MAESKIALTKTGAAFLRLRLFTDNTSKDNRVLPDKRGTCRSAGKTTRSDSKGKPALAERWLPRSCRFPGRTFGGKAYEMFR